MSARDSTTRLGLEAIDVRSALRQGEALQPVVKVLPAFGRRSIVGDDTHEAKRAARLR